MITSTALFTLGSGISGCASNIEMLIAGRLIQGIGASGITVLTEIIICDLLPLKERGRYLGIMLRTYKSPKHPRELIQGDIPSSQSLKS
jgi:MFS family permease